MNNDSYHGILIDVEFMDKKYPERFKIFARHVSRSNPWILFGVEVEMQDLNNILPDIQKAMRDDEPFYLHFYNDKELIVVFKKEIFRATPHASTWGRIIEYGRSLNIPKQQMDFWPNRFQDERHYFVAEEFVAGA